MIWIAGVWHFYGNYPPEYQFSPLGFKIAGIITEIVLATFTFLSGFFLSKYIFVKKNDVVFFYRKRFWRFYVLFIIAVLCMFMLFSMESGGITKQGVIQMLSSLLGLSLFFPPPISTLWYLSMLLMFYILTPLFRYSYSDKKVNLIWIITIFLILVVSFIVFKIDDRLLLYYPFYVIGLFFPKHLFEKISSAKWIPVFVGGAICLGYIMLCRNEFYLKYTYLIFGVPMLISICYLIYFKRLNKIVSWASYATMCVYLFHRFLYPVVILMFSKTINGYKYMEMYYVILSIVIFFVVGYGIQKAYDIVINKLVYKN